MVEGSLILLRHQTVSAKCATRPPTTPFGSAAFGSSTPGEEEMLGLRGFASATATTICALRCWKKGVPFEADDRVQVSQTREYLATIPDGKVPFLDVEGQLLRESPLILGYLEDVYSPKPLLPRIHSSALERVNWSPSSSCPSSWWCGACIVACLSVAAFRGKQGRARPQGGGEVRELRCRQWTS